MRQRYKYGLYFVIVNLIGIFSCLSYAQGITALKDFVHHIKTAQGTFHQIQSNSVGKVIVKTSGKFIFSRPGKFIWSTLKPYEQLLQSDGQSLYVWDKDLNQVTIRKLDQAIASSPAAILFGSNTLEHYFKLKEELPHDGINWVKLEPLTQDTTFTEIKIGFRNHQLTGMKLNDALGNTTELIFTHLNTTLATTQSDFDFKIPPNADVIQQ